MVAGGIIHTDWLNENRNRNYPFFDNASLRDTSGSMEIPNELIVDLIFPVSAVDYDVAKFHVSQIVVFDGGVTISIGFDGTTIATRTITDAEHTENKSYYIEGSGGFIDSLGRITIGRLVDIKNYGGTYSFSSTNARLLPTVLRPSLKGVRGLRVVNANNETSSLIQGEIQLVAGDNIGLVLAGNKLTVSAENNPAFDVECQCPDVVAGDPIRTINGIGPDATGAFWIAGDGCVAVDNSAITNGIQLQDTCATPCCGCKELDVLQNELSRLGTQVASQLSFAQRAMSSVEQLRDVVLSSKFGSIVPC